MGNCHLEKNNVDRGEAEIDIGFRGVTISCFLLVQSVFIILYWMLIKYIVFITNKPGHMNIWVCISYSVYLNAHTTPVRIYGEPYAHKFCAVDIFLEYHPSSSNITHCQVPSRRRGFMIQWMILIFIKCLSANQNRLFCMKV